jgi:predicted DsbA family dithiol-disulfide isomerase
LSSVTWSPETRSSSPKRSSFSGLTRSPLRAAFAASQQDCYWQYAALLFENQGAENSGYVTDEFLTNLAQETEGLDVSEWNEARQSGFERELQAAQQRAEEDGINSTPSLVVSGPDGQVTLRGAVPTEDVDRAIEEVGS